MGNNGVAEPCFLLNGRNSDSKAFTVCVLGAPRGGTSMISGILQIMGVNMGDEMDEDNLEDQEFLTHRGDREILQNSENPSRNSYLERIRASIDRKNAKYAIWGWKDPLSIYYLDDIAPLLRNPIYIWITRDPIAISEREFMQQKPARATHRYIYINQVLSQYHQIGEFLAKQGSPVLLISYERSLRNPIALYSAIVGAIGFEKDSMTLDKVIDYVQPDRLTGKLCHFQTKQHERVRVDYERHLRNSLMYRQKMHAIEMFYGHDTAKREDSTETLIKAAEQDMLNNQFQSSIEKLEQALWRFQDTLPALSYGPQAVSASLRYSIGLPNTPKIPDVVVKIFYLIGISLLQIHRPYDAIMCFSASFDLATRKLMYKQALSPESERYFIWAKFHEAFAAKLLGAPNLLIEALRELANLKYTSIYMASDVVKSAYHQAMQRAESELVV